MPKLVHTPPKYRHHKPSGRAVVTGNGKDRYLGKYGSKASRVEYSRLVAEWEANNARIPSGRPKNDLTVTELVTQYWRFAGGYITSRTVALQRPSLESRLPFASYVSRTATRKRANLALFASKSYGVGASDRRKPAATHHRPPHQCIHASPTGVDRRQGLRTDRRGRGTRAGPCGCQRRVDLG